MDRAFDKFLIDQRHRFRQSLNSSVQRVRTARNQTRQAHQDEWEARRPGSIGHSMGRTKPTLAEYEGETSS